MAYKKQTNNYLSKSLIIVGRHPVEESLLNNAEKIDRILISKTATGDGIQNIKKLAQQNKIPFQVVPIEKLNRLTNIQHQGVIAFKSFIQYYELQDIIDDTVGKGITPFLALLDGVTDTRNIGAIARSALCMGVHALVIPEKGVAAINEEAIKASAGALEQIPICRIQNWSDTVKLLELNGFLIWNSLLNSKQNIEDVQFEQPTAVVLGAEGLGVQEELQQLVKNNFYIHMPGNFDSLNVSVSAGIIFYIISKKLFS